MVIQGKDYYDYDWYDIVGCVVNDPIISLKKEDINHLMLKPSSSLTMEDSFISFFSFRDTNTNPTWIISSLQTEENDLNKTNPVINEISHDPHSSNQYGIEEEHHLSTYSSILPKQLYDDSSISCYDSSPSQFMHHQSDTVTSSLSSPSHDYKPSNIGFNKRFHTSYHPNSIIVGSNEIISPTNRQTPQETHYYSDDVMSDSCTIVFLPIPFIQTSDSFVCFIYFINYYFYIIILSYYLHNLICITRFP